jgi:Domain of unknown function (DUF222)/HNH endonuclease
VDDRLIDVHRWTRIKHMFETSRSESCRRPLCGSQAPLDASDVRGWAAGLARVDRDVSDAERVEQLRALEELKAAAAAAQARVAAEFVASQCAEQTAAGVRGRDVGKGVTAQVALARRESPHRGNTLVGLARALVHEMPHTLAAMEAGVLSEYRAVLLVKQTACLTREDRRRVDAEVCGDLERVSALGNRRLAGEAARVAYRLDPQAVADRAAHAVRERRVSLRPAPDTMVWLTALLPVAQGVACYAALTAAADTARVAGDRRCRGQVMADTLVQRTTGHQHAETVPVTVNLVMTDRTLLAADAEPAHLAGYGPVPAQTARELVRRAADRAWLRRLFVHPSSGQLAAIESTARCFPPGLVALIAARDQLCRTPWCDAPIRHTDHVTAAAVGGATRSDNGQGLCEACNQAKEAAGWRSRTSPWATRAGPHTVAVTTPTGHRYLSRAPDPPGTRAPRRHSTRPRADLAFHPLRLDLAA